MKKPIIALGVFLLTSCAKPNGTSLLTTAPQREKSEINMNNSTDQRISSADAWKLIHAGALVFDVRTSDEFKEGAIAGAINIPHTEVKNRLSEFGPKTGTIVVYCRSGHRSSLARKDLLEAGFTKVYNAGGFEDLNSEK